MLNTKLSWHLAIWTRTSEVRQREREKGQTGGPFGFVDRATGTAEVADRLGEEENINRQMQEIRRLRAVEEPQKVDDVRDIQQGRTRDLESRVFFGRYESQTRTVRNRRTYC